MEANILGIITLLFMSNILVSQICFDPLDEPAVISNNYRNRIIYEIGMLKSYSIDLNSLDEVNYSENGQAIFSTGFARSIWAGGFNSNGDFRLAANTYPFESTRDYLAGPIVVLGIPVLEYCNFYNRAWRVSRSEIIALIASYDQGDLELVDIPIDILEWPARMNPYIGRFSPDEEMAPFYDRNIDGIYDPVDGDYPIVLSENPDFIPDGFMFTVYNDARPHFASTGDIINMEFHQLDYIVNCEDQSLESEKSIFTRLKYIYKGEEELSSFKIGIWNDDDFGCNTNDYVGCDTTLNCTYTYNRDGEDNMSNIDCDIVNPVPGGSGAIQTIISLNNPIKSFIGYNNLRVGDPENATVDPQGADQYYSYLSGEWLNRELLTIGNAGHNPGSMDTTNFIYHDLPNNVNGWSMQNVNSSEIVDVRTVLTVVDIEKMESGHQGFIDFADHILYDEATSGLDVFEKWPDKVNAVKADYAKFLDGTLDCNILSSEEAAEYEDSEFRLFPNPTGSILRIHFARSFEGIANIYNSQGCKVDSYVLADSLVMEFEISHLDRGFYVLTITNIEGDVKSEVFVKN